MSRTVGGPVVVAVAMVLSIGAAPRDAAGQVSSTTASASEGADLFVRTCVVCHGPFGSGGRGPALRGANLTAAYVREVIVAGKPGTLMPAFSPGLTPDQVRLIARYVSSLQGEAASAVARPAVPASIGERLAGDPVAGEAVFFNSGRTYSCYVCHSVNGRGGRVGPDLARSAAVRPAHELFDKIVHIPHRPVDRAYATARLTTRVEILTGISAGEDQEFIRFYDTRNLPPVLRVVKKTDIVSLRPVPESVMPADYASRLSLKELLDVVAFLKSQGGITQRIRLEDLVSMPVGAGSAR